MFTTLKAALDALPHGAEAIADHLETMGVQGTCSSGILCAIAEYLTATVEIPAGHVVRVSNNSASIGISAHPIVAPVSRCWFGDVGLNEHTERPDITDFIRNFDRGQYPTLVRGGMDSEPVAA